MPKPAWAPVGTLRRKRRTASDIMHLIILHLSILSSSRERILSPIQTATIFIDIISIDIIFDRDDGEKV
jgi:hypothetical protein